MLTPLPGLCLASYDISIQVLFPTFFLEHGHCNVYLLRCCHGEPLASSGPVKHVKPPCFFPLLPSSPSPRLCFFPLSVFLYVSRTFSCRTILSSLLWSRSSLSCNLSMTCFSGWTAGCSSLLCSSTLPSIPPSEGSWRLLCLPSSVDQTPPPLSLESSPIWWPATSDSEELRWRHSVVHRILRGWSEPQAFDEVLFLDSSTPTPHSMRRQTVEGAFNSYLLHGLRLEPNNLEHFWLFVFPLVLLCSLSSFYVNLPVKL